MDKSRLEIEVVLPGTMSVGPFWFDHRCRRPAGTTFNQLPRTTVTVPEVETLRRLLGTAGDALGVRVLDMEKASKSMARTARSPDWEAVTSDPRNVDSEARFEEFLRFAAFVLPGDEDAEPAVTTDKRLHLTRIATVETNGLARWDVDPLEAMIGDLVRAGDAGLIDGDPRRPYLIVQVPAGDLGAIGSSWSALEETFKIVWQAATALGVAYSATQAVGALLRRLGKARGVISSYESSWSARGGRPSDLSDVLGARPRSASEVAALLGCRHSDAEALLWGLGFRERDGLWGPSNDPDDEALATLRRLIAARDSVSSEHIRKEVDQILEDLVDRPNKD